MKRKIFVTVISSVVLILNSCNSNPVDSSPQPGRRDYTWTLTEIKPGNETLLLTDIWGSSPQNIFALGPSSWTATSIWHYNGVRWGCDSIPKPIFSPHGIFGVGNKVWLGDNNSSIWELKGETTWQKFGEYKPDGYNHTSFNHFDALTENNVFATGYTEVYNSDKVKAILMRYNDSQWTFVNIPDTKVSFETIAIDPLSGVAVISGTIYDPSGFIPKVYCWDGNNLTDLPFNGPGYTYVSRLGNEIFVSAGSKIYKYFNKQLTLWKDNTGTTLYGRLWCGRSRNDFFIKDYNGISHYNGTDFSVLYKTSFDMWRGIIFEKDVFFIAYDKFTGKNYIIHGELK